MAASFWDRSRYRLSITLAAAAAIHAACAFFGHRLAHNEVPLEAAAEPAVETDIELFDARVAASGDDAMRPAEEAVGAAAGVGPSLVARVSRTIDARRAGAPQGGEAAPSVDTGAGESGYALDPLAASTSREGDRRDGAPGSPEGTLPGPRVELGIGAGDWSRWVDPTATPVVDAPRRGGYRPAPVSSTGGLAEALEAHDERVGLGPAGGVLTAVHEAGYSAIAPALGTALFSVTVLASGAVEVKLSGASSEPAAWTKVGESIAAALRKKPPRIPSARTGVRLGVEVIAEERWPNGQATRSDHGPQIVAAAPRLQTTETAKEELRTRNPLAVTDPEPSSGKAPVQLGYQAPGLFVEGRGKVCSYRIGLSPIPISGGCDPANIGAKARRVVSARVVDQTML